MKYVGIKQVLKAAKSCEVTKVYIGKDAEEHVVQELILVCNENKIEIVYIETMEDLGKLAGIDIGAATAAE
jgi:large subunit ribosomal protein L7A